MNIGKRSNLNSFVLKRLRHLKGLKKFYLFMSLLSIFSTPLHADFVNGNFEAPYPSADPLNPIFAWTITGYTYNGAISPIPSNIIDLSQLLLGPTSSLAPDGISDMIANAMPQSLFDYFLEGAIPTPLQKLPISGTQSASINLRSVNAPLMVAGNVAPTPPAPPWVLVPKEATSLTQRMIVQPSDISSDGYFHVRFKSAIVLDNPNNPVNQQPFIAVQVNNLTAGIPIAFQWTYADQPGITWESLAMGAGTNLGSSTSYLYTQIKAFDLAQDLALAKVGEEIELIVMGSGSSVNGYEGHLYLDNVTTSIPEGLWISVMGPTATSPGQTITYVYTYTNNQPTAANNVSITANLPERSGLPLESVTFVSVTTPTAGTSPTCTGTGPINCSIGALLPFQTGTFNLTVTIPSTWNLFDDGPVNNGNYSITDTQTSLLGNLFQTFFAGMFEMSNLSVNVSGLPTTGDLGVPYNGSYSCSNLPNAFADGDAYLGTCSIYNLPPGINFLGCTITPGNTPWVAPDYIPINETVTCQVSGIPTTLGTFDVAVNSNSFRNASSITNHAIVPVSVAISPLLSSNLVVNGDGLPTIGSLQAPYLGTYTCTNTPSSSATGDAPNATCSISSLPPGLTVSGCTISPLTIPWVEPSLIPSSQTVTCQVSGVLESAGTFNLLVSSNALNNINTTTNQVLVPLLVNDLPSSVTIPATLNGSPLLNPAIIGCGRPVLLGPLPLPGLGETTYSVIQSTGNVLCFIGKSGWQTYLKIQGCKGSCTIIGTKNGVVSAPLTVIAS